MENIISKAYSFFSRKIVYHSVFWLALLILLTLVEGIENGLLFTFSNELINLFFYGAIVYFNLIYLIPNYLSKNKFTTYFGLLALSTIIITPLKIFTFYVKFHEYPGLQAELLNNQFSFFLLTFFIAGASTIGKIISDWIRHMREKQELENQTMQSELRFLKTQINPHFLFNTLNNLYALTLKKSDIAPDIVIKLSEMMRYMLYECNEKRVLLSNEVHYIRNYLDLEGLRQGKNVEIKFEVEGKITTQKIAPLMFTPFLENSFKHGLSNHISKGFVHIQLKAEENSVHFHIENSKPESKPVQVHPRSGGIGLVNLRRRLELVYPNRYQLHVDDNPNTYGVTMDIELD
jgi:two-component system LytT family sensor kinase